MHFLSRTIVLGVRQCAAAMGFTMEHALALALTHYRGSLWDLPGSQISNTHDSPPHWLKKLHFQQRLAFDDSKDMHALMRHSRRMELVLFPTTDMGPDLVLLLSETKQAPVPSVPASSSSVTIGSAASADNVIPVYIQSKLRAQRKGQWDHARSALRSVNPGLFYVEKRDHYDRNPLQIADKTASLFAAYPGLMKRFVRVYFRSAGFGQKMIGRINTYNSKNPDTPILLMTTDESLFGATLYDALIGKNREAGVKQSCTINIAAVLQVANPLSPHTWDTSLAPPKRSRKNRAAGAGAQAPATAKAGAEDDPRLVLC
jgi:hypothetical protein